MDVYEALAILTLTLELLLHQGHSMALTSAKSSSSECTDRYVNFALHSCHTYLADVSTAILHTTSANYSQVCR